MTFWTTPPLYRKESIGCCMGVVLTLTIASMSAVIDLLVSVLLQSEIQGFLAIDATKAVWLGKAFFFAAAISPLYATYLAGVFGYKKIYLFGLIIFWIGSISTAFCQDYITMLLCRSLSGTGGGIVMAVSLSYLTHILPQQHEKKALVFYSNTFLGLGIAAGVLIGGYLGQAYHWKEAFLMNIHVALPNLALVLFLLPETEKIKKSPYDFLGFLLYCGAFLALLIVIVEAKNPATSGGWHSPFIQSTLLISCLLFILFLAKTPFTQNPLIRFRLFLNPRFALASLGLIVMGFQIFGVTLASMNLYEFVYNYQRSTMGYLVCTLGFIYCFVGVIPTLLANRIHTRYFILLGLALIVYSNFHSQTLTIQSTIWQIAYYQTLRSIGVAFLLGPFAVMAISSLREEDLPKANAFMASLRFMAATFGSALVDLIKLERVPFHTLRFGEQVDIQSTRYLNYVTDFQQRLLEITSKGPWINQEEVTQFLIQYIKNQAMIASVNDAALILGYMTLGVFFCVLTFTIKKIF